MILIGVFLPNWDALQSSITDLKITQFWSIFVITVVDNWEIADHL